MINFLSQLSTPCPKPNSCGLTALHLGHELFIRVTWHRLPDGVENESVQRDCILTLQTLMKGFLHVACSPGPVGIENGLPISEESGAHKNSDLYFYATTRNGNSIKIQKNDSFSGAARVIWLILLYHLTHSSEHVLRVNLCQAISVHHGT